MGRTLMALRFAPWRLMPLALKSDHADALDASSLEPRTRSVPAFANTSFLAEIRAGNCGVRSFDLLHVGLARAVRLKSNLERLEPALRS